MGRNVTYRIDVDEKGAVKGTDKVVDSLKQVDRQAQRTGKSSTQLAGQMASAGQGTAMLERNSRGANQVLFSMSDAINDASFAGGSLANVARFAGNNIAMGAEQFAVMSQRAGGAKGALQAVIGSLTGVGGIIFGLNLAIVALNLFGDSLFSAGEEAEDLSEDLDTLMLSFDKTIEMQEKFGAFADDESGVQKMQATIREATEDLDEQYRMLTRVTDAREEQERIEQRIQQLTGPNMGALTEQREQELLLLQQQYQEQQSIINLWDKEEDIRARIAELERERVRTSIQLAETGEALADTDTKQAQEAQKAAEAKKRQLEYEEALAAARRNLLPEAPEDSIMDEIDLSLESLDLDLTHRFFPPGSLGAMQQQLRGLKDELMTATDPEQISQLNSAIRTTQDEMTELRGGTEAAGQTYQDQMALAIASQMMMADSAAEAGNMIIDTILAQIVAIAIKKAMEALPFPFNIVAAAGAAAAAKGLRSLIPEFQQGGIAMGPSHAQGGMIGMVGGRPAFEFEGGEAIINRESTRRYLPILSQINQAGGGIPFAGRGLVMNHLSGGSAGDLPMPRPADMASAIREGLESANVVARVELTELRDQMSRLQSKLDSLA